MIAKATPAVTEAQGTADPSAGTRAAFAGLSRLVQGALDLDFVDVPPYPPIARRLQQLLTRGDYRTSDLAEMIRYDEGLTASVIRHAQTPAYQQLMPATTIEQAVSRIGSRGLVNVVSALGIAKAIDRRSPLSTLRHAVWRHAVTSAELARRIATLRRADEELAFTAALLRRIGRVIGIACIEDGGPAPGDVPVAPLGEWLSFLDAHADPLAAHAAHAWRLPAPLAELITGQARSDATDIASLIEAAEAIALLSDQHAAVTPVLLAQGTREITAHECEPLAKLLPEVPPAVASLALSSPEDATPSAVLPDEERAASPALSEAIPTMTGDSRNPTVYRLTHAGTNALRLRGSRFQQPESLIHLCVARPEHELRFWARVHRCDRRGHEFVVEARPYALSPLMRSEWLTLTRESAL